MTNLDQRGLHSPLPAEGRDGECELVPLSFAQQRLWVLDRLLPDGAIYNVPKAWRLRGEVDVGALRGALNELVRRHEVLRTRYVTVDGQPMQEVMARVEVPLAVEDLGALAGDERAERARQRVHEEAWAPFDLARGPMLTARLLRLSESEHWLIVRQHHIATDGWSLAVLWRELSALYGTFARNEHSPLPELTLQYADYAMWQREWLRGAKLDREVAYWKEALADLPVLELPADRPRPAVATYRGGRLNFELGEQLTRELKALARRERATLFMTLLAAFYVLLYRYSGQEDVAVGVPIAGRTRPELEGLIGLFVNTLVLRGDLSGEPGFRELLGRVRERALAAYEHQHLPFEKLVDELGVRRDLSQNPLFQTSFQLRNTPGTETALGDLAATPVEIDGERVKFDLCLELRESPGGLVGRLDYASDLFDRERMERMLGHWRVLLEGIVADPEQRISRLPLLTERERHQLLVEWNDTATAYPRDKCVHQLFEEQVARTPDAVAVVCGQSQLTYAELNASANQLARHLQTLSVGPGVAVAVFGERSIEAIVALLAILKAGGAYVPLDPAYPAARLKLILDDTGARALLVPRAMRLPWYAGTVVSLADWSVFAQRSTADIDERVDALQLAYIMFTSGSTGIPKGVAVPHRAVVRLVRCTRYVQFDSRQVFLLLAPLAFDASTFEIWGALLNGARCVVVPERTPSLQVLGEVIAGQGVTTLWLTAALFNAVIDRSPQILAPVKQLLTGGEALSVSHVRRALAELPGTSVINGYGPTEGTTFTCCFRVPRSGTLPASGVPIGRPIANSTTYVLDKHLHPVPVAVPGELYIGGAGVAQGYLHRPELTAERFTPNPFSTEAGRLYRTGDIVRYMADGNIEFLGRVDDQVKIRGYRIEPGEIEAALTGIAGVREAVVVVRGDNPGEKRLVAYVTLASGGAPTTASIRECLAARLPDYMVPAAMVVLESLPLTANGKVDRHALPPEAAGQAPVDPLDSPRGALEVQLLRIWEGVLKPHPVRVTDDFFEIGGHSLAAIQVVDRVNQLFDCDLPVDVLWRRGRTVRGLAEIIRDKDGKSIWSRAVPIKRSGSLRPLFCAPIVGGHLFFYDNLARFVAPDQPVFGLPARGTDGKDAPDSSVEAMGAHGIRLMREIQPSGPYSLLGYCSGGVVAYEMARQLETQGEYVALLGLVDSAAPGTYFSLRQMLRQTLWAKRDLRLLQQQVYYLALHSTGLKRLRRLDTLEQAHRWALWSYRPGPLRGKAVLIRPAVRGRDDDPSLGWTKYVQGGVEVRTLSGKHGDLVHVERGADRLAEELATWLA